MRVIGSEGEQLGILAVEEALAKAESEGLDLVEVAPTARPPVVRIMDYGKFKYEEARKARQARKKQHHIQVKEVKFRPGTDEGDYKIKMRNLIKFLEDGDKAKADCGPPGVHQSDWLAFSRVTQRDFWARTEVGLFSNELS